jgi:1-acyl-sn-glycerol-3-phosphate acyltransferase
MKTSAKAAGPAISHWMMEWFSRYAVSYVGRHFHAARVLDEPSALGAGPVVIYLNHASWWDPLISILLWRQFFAGRDAYAPIDAAALRKYAFFKRLGFFPVRQQSMRGVIDFLQTSECILGRPNTMLWVTPQGRFADVREAPVFRAGLAELAVRVPEIVFVPLAIEYTYWQERKPEVCISFGRPRTIGREVSRQTANAELERSLVETQQRLADAVIRRNAQDFKVLQRRTSGVGGIYDIWRRLRAAARLQRFQPQHGVET